MDTATDTATKTTTAPAQATIPARPPAAPVTPGDLRTTMGRFATGVVVVTVGGDVLHGMTANSFTSVSLDPPLVLVCVAKTALMHSAVEAAGHFAVSVLAADQQDRARHFADRRRPLGRAQFDPVDWAPGPATGAPVLAGALAWLDCTLVDSHAAGDHTVFLGRVEHTGSGADTDALLFYGGAYRRTDRNA
ncbi:flavin reductase family protein [Actinokineospora pegani]|uniref:flavin reductase family protein n=1 Tax=Actinokineospora pegani TaxID=2654637 RepID=UPI0012EA0D5A|nr:flavin reductase family protein [Actinokineospora pegani]